MVGAYKAPRAISAHVKTANVVNYAGIHAFERSLLSILDLDGSPFFAKGMNIPDRGEVIREKAKGKVVYSLDMSSFDNSIRGGLIKGELDALSHLLGVSFDASVYDALITYGFDDYALDGQEAPLVRKSGDLQTGCGNCAVMLFLARKAQSRLSSLRFFCDGDDTLMFVEPKQEDLGC